MNNVFRIAIPLITGTLYLAANNTVHAQINANTVIDENYIKTQSSVDDHSYDITTIDYDASGSSWGGTNYPRALVFGNRKHATDALTYLFSQRDPRNIGLVANGKLGLVVNNEGKVGIGTINPGNLLQLQNTMGAAGLSIGFSTNGGATPTQAEIRVVDNNWSADMLFKTTVPGSGTGALTERMRIANNGNIGIGTNTPAYILDVKGRSRFAAGNGSAGFWLTKNDAVTDRLFIGMADDNHAGFWGNSGWGLIMNADNGNVGIGTTTPHSPLQFSNGISNRKVVLYEESDNNNQFYGLGINSSILRYQVSSSVASHVFYAGIDANSSKELVRIMGNGNVGIGTTSPSSTLDIQGSGLTIRNGVGYNGGSGNQVYFGWSQTATYQHAIKTRHNGGAMAGNAIDFYVWKQGTDAITSISPSQHVMTMDGRGTGSVGIGTTTPIYKLQLVTEGSRASAGSAISVNGSTSPQLDVMPYIQTSLRLNNTASSTSEAYNAGFGVSAFGTGTNLTTPFLDIETSRDDMPIVMEINDKATMQIFKNQVLIGSNLAPPTAGAVAPYSGLNYTLGVRGRIVSSGITCKDLSQWADYVFDDSYELKPLDEVSEYIAENKHLPDVPSAKEVIEKGIDVSDMLKIQMQKIEELTLYTIEQQKQLKEQQKQIDQLVRAGSRSATTK